MGEDGEELPCCPYTYLPNSAKNGRALLQTTGFPMQPSLALAVRVTGTSAHTLCFMGQGRCSTQLPCTHRHKTRARQNKCPNCNFCGLTVTSSFLSSHNTKSAWTACKCAQNLSLPAPQLYLKISVSVAYSFTDSRLES